MQPSRARLICRSHNPFTPSIALWQHFVLPGRPFVHLQRPAYSTLTKDEPSISSQHPSRELQTPTVTQNHINEDNPIDEPFPLPPAPSIRAVYNSLPESSSRTPTPYGGPHIRKVGRSSLHTRQNDRPWVDYTRDAEAEANPNGPEALLVQTQNTIDKTGDYEGVVMKSKPVKDKRYLKEKDLPWIVQPTDTGAQRDDGEWSVPAMERLEVEMMRFHEYLKPSRVEALARRQLIEQVRSHAREALPDATLEVFGSERTGLAFATSDIDLRLLKVADLGESTSDVLPPSKTHRLRLLNDIYRLSQHLRKNSRYEHCAVLHARYPLVSVRDKASGLDVQIVLSNDTSLSRTLIRKYIEEYPFIRPVYSVVKTMFDIRGLSDTFRGGFGSYTIFMMIVASFRHCDGNTPPASAGEGLKAFIDFWTDFDTTKKGISLEPTELYEKATDAPMTPKVRSKLQNKEIRPVPDFCLSLRDPADETNDLGRRALAIKHLRETLKHSVKKEFYKRLLRNKETSLLHPLVTPIYGLTIDERRKLSEQGLKISKDFDGSLASKAKQIREALASADSESPKHVVPLESVKPDDESFSQAGDACSETPTGPVEVKQTVLGSPRPSTTSMEKESKAQATKSSASPSVQEGASSAQIQYVAIPFKSEEAMKVAEGYVEGRDKLMKRGVQLPSIALASQEFRSKSASETQRNYESTKRKHEKALKRLEDAKEKLGKTVEFEATPGDKVAESQDAVTVQVETSSSYAMKTESERAATPPSELPIEQVETKVEEVIEPPPVEALVPTPVEVTEPTLVEAAGPTSVQAVEPEAVETISTETRESRSEESVKPALVGATQTKQEQAIEAAEPTTVEAAEIDQEGTVSPSSSSAPETKLNAQKDTR